MTETMPQLAFSACGNTRENMTRAEAKDIPLISQAKVVEAGVVRLMELQERGWSYRDPDDFNRTSSCRPDQRRWQSTLDGSSVTGHLRPQTAQRRYAAKRRSGSPLQSSRDAGLADGLDADNSATAPLLFSGSC
jgi:hypothetical protein